MRSQLQVLVEIVQPTWYSTPPAYFASALAMLPERPCPDMTAPLHWIRLPVQLQGAGDHAIAGDAAIAAPARVADTAAPAVARLIF